MIKNKSLLILSSAIALLISGTGCVSTTVSEEKTNETSADTYLEENIKIEEDKETDKEFIKSLDNVFITIKNAPRVGTVGNNFVRPFTISVNDNEGNPLQDYPITIEYPSAKENSNLINSKENVKTNSEGKYIFTAPKLTFSSCTDFKVYPTPVSENKKVVESVNDKAALTPWVVKSDLASKGCLLVFWDFYENGKYCSSFSELQVELRGGRGIYNVGNAPSSGSNLIDEPIEEVYKANYEIVGGDSYGYLVYGKVKFTSPVTKLEDGGYTCTLTGDLQVLKMSDGSVVLEKVIEQDAVGKNWNDVVSKCKKKVASKIADSLLYDLN